MASICEKFNINKDSLSKFWIKETSKNYVCLNYIFRLLSECKINLKGVPTIGSLHLDENGKTTAEEKTRTKKVCQFNKSGEYVKTHKNMASVSRLLNISKTTISHFFLKNPEFNYIKDDYIWRLWTECITKEGEDPKIPSNYFDKWPGNDPITKTPKKIVIKIKKI